MSLEQGGMSAASTSERLARIETAIEEITETVAQLGLAQCELGDEMREAREILAEKPRADANPAAWLGLSPFLQQCIAAWIMSKTPAEFRPE